MKKYRGLSLMAAVLLCAGMLQAGVSAGETEESGAQAETETAAEGYTADPDQIAAAGKLDTSKVADASEMAESEQVDDGLTPVTADQLNEGTYSVKVESSSSMFRIEDCRLTVKDGSMTADLTLGGTGYLFLYPGTAEEASAADAEDFIYFEENGDGKYVFMQFPVKALDQKVSCAAFSKKKQQWYPRTLEFESASLPGDAWADTGNSSASEADADGDDPSAAAPAFADGTYTAEVTFDGSGSVTAVSPMELTVENGSVRGKLVLETSKADYVKVDGVKCEAEDGAGKDQTVFTVPVPVFDHAFSVTVDSTAIAGMNVEKDYSLTVDSSSVKQ